MSLERRHAWLLAGLLLPLPAGDGGPDRLGYAMAKRLAERPWVSAPSSTATTDGLGPLYNAKSCTSCHQGGGRGTVDGPGLVLRLGDAHGAPDPFYGRQLQDQAVPGQEAEGRLAVTWQALPVRLDDGTVLELRRPEPVIDAPRAATTALSLRLAPPIAGLGLVERLPEALILAADPDDRDGDGISGRPHRLADGAIGRFGWKAGTAGLDRQVADALMTDLGLSSRLRPDPWGDCTSRQPACRAAPAGAPDRAGPYEAMDQVLDLLTLLLRGTRPPTPQPPPAATAASLRGEGLFAAVGCGACHTRRLGDLPLGSDLLLHAMGDGLADGVGEGDAAPGEWRTAPLWGLGHGGALLHDGRARDPAEAILWHGGEGSAAAGRFRALPADERQALLAFLEQL